MARVTEIEELVRLAPREAAARVFGSADDDWARRFATELDRRLRAGPITRLASTWQLSNTDIGRMFGVSRQAVAKWTSEGVPADRQERLSELDAATELLDRYVRADRIPAVVRRRSEALQGESLLEVALAGRSTEVLEAVREMFDLRRVQP